LSLHLNAIDTP